MNIYLIRHGRSKDDEKGVGQTLETSLSNFGKQELENLKKNVYDKIKFDLIYYSPQARARQSRHQIIGIVGHGVFFKHLVGYWKMGDKYQPKIFFDRYQKQKIENGVCIELE